MAFWFFITISAYFFLWIVTGDQNTLTNGVLALIGISAGTALGAAFVDAGKNPEPALSFAPKVDLTQKNEDIIKSLMDSRATALKAVETAQLALNADLANSPVIEAKVEEDKRALDARRYELDAIDRYISFFKAPPWRRVLFDLLGDNGVIGFHRFQIFVWTLVLGVIFVANVYSGLSMPDFSPTLLALMGISAGTYIGFKIPEKN